MAKSTAKQKAEQRDFKLQNTPIGLHRKNADAADAMKRVRALLKALILG